MEVAEGLQKRREEDEHRRRVAKGASSGPAHIKSDGRTGMTGELKAVQSSGETAPSPRKASDHDIGSRFEHEIPTVELSSKAELEGLSSAVDGPTPIVGEFRPNGAIDISNGLGPDSQSDPKPKDCSKPSILAMVWAGLLFEVEHPFARDIFNIP